MDDNSSCYVVDQNVLQDESQPPNMFSSNHLEQRLESEMKEESDLAGVYID